MPKKPKTVKRRGRRNAFDAALDKAVKRLQRATEEQERHESALAALALEIPDLQNKIVALGGTPESASARRATFVPLSSAQGGNRQMPVPPGFNEAIASELHAAPTYASSGLLTRKAPVPEISPAEATAAARRTVAADDAVRRGLITSIPANNGTPAGDANILDGTGVREAGDDLPDVDGRVLAEGDAQ